MLCTLQVTVRGREVVKENDRAVSGREELLERQNLAAVSQGTAGKQAQFGQRVKDDAGGTQLVHTLQNGFHVETSSTSEG
jgi:hypothetical protein